MRNCEISMQRGPGNALDVYLFRSFGATTRLPGWLTELSTLLSACCYGRLHGPWQSGESYPCDHLLRTGRLTGQSESSSGSVLPQRISWDPLWKVGSPKPLRRFGQTREKNKGGHLPAKIPGCSPRQAVVTVIEQLQEVAQEARTAVLR